MRQPALPNFFVVGAGKAGTTSLYHYLRQHPQIYMSPVKEPSFFTSELRTGVISKDLQRNLRRQSPALRRLFPDSEPIKPLGWLVLDWHDYERLFRNVKDETAIGEASPTYLWSQTAAAEIHARVPEARIVMILRDPAERAFSQYLHQLAVGLVRSTFREHIQRCAQNQSRGFSVFHPFLEIGFYHQQVKRYLELFPRDHIRIYWYEDDWCEPQRLLSDLFRFLEVDPAFQPDTSRKSLERRAPRHAGAHYLLKKAGLWYPLRALVPARLRSRVRKLAFQPGAALVMEPADRQYLTEYYREDIQALAALLSRDLSAWLR